MEQISTSADENLAVTNVVEVDIGYWSQGHVDIGNEHLTILLLIQIGRQGFKEADCCSVGGCPHRASSFSR